MAWLVLIDRLPRVEQRNPRPAKMLARFDWKFIHASEPLALSSST
jgi:hypothetical protein